MHCDCRNTKVKSQSPLTPVNRSSQIISTKITSTSLFMELVKDRNKREQELKKLENLLEKKNAVKPTSEETKPDSENISTDIPSNQDNNTPVMMDIDDIPIPSDSKIEETRLNEIALPAVNNVSNNKAIPLPPRTPPLPGEKGLTPPNKTEVDGTVSKEKVKIKSVTKLPMPPGINQTDLEEIESPPSCSPTPPPQLVKAKTPPKKGIMNLPMPPGKFFFC